MIILYTGSNVIMPPPPLLMGGVFILPYAYDLVQPGCPVNTCEVLVGVMVCQCILEPFPVGCIIYTEVDTDGITDTDGYKISACRYPLVFHLFEGRCDHVRDCLESTMHLVAQFFYTSGMLFDL